MATLVRLVHVLRASSFPQSTIVRAFYGIALLALCITLIMTAALPTPMWFGNSFTPVPYIRGGEPRQRKCLHLVYVASVVFFTYMRASKLPHLLAGV